MGKVIHVMRDEKFNDMAIRQFEEVAPGVGEYFVLSNKFVFTKSPLAIKCEKSRLLDELKRGDVVGVVFHGLPPTLYSLLDCVSADKRVVWLGWGFDYYSLVGAGGGWILPGTSRLMASTSLDRIKYFIKNIYQKVFYSGFYSRKVLQRVDYFSPVLDSEYKIVVRDMRLRAKYIEWNYGTAEDDFSFEGAGADLGCNVLAGNSATATNNHIEMFESISDQIDLTGRKVIVPLSYGDFRYRDKILVAGHKILGSAFFPLVEFLPVDDYRSIIHSCGFVVMNHLRQQALGNVCMAMLLGAKVYLNERNPLVEWLKIRGGIVGSTSDIDMMPLSENEVEKNRSVICSHWGREAQSLKTKWLLDAIFGEEK